MSMTAELQRAEKRLAEMIEARCSREEAEARTDAAERMQAERERAREDAEKRRQYQARYADAFQSFGSQPPPPIEGERPGQYRARLFEHLRHRLPSTHEWAGVRADDIPPSARANIEALVINAAVAEGAAPSPENLPRDGSMVTRVRVDPNTNARRTEFFGTRSFIHDFSMQPKTVVRIVDPKSKAVLFGAPFPRAP